MPQQKQAGAIRPVQVLDREHNGLAAGDTRKQIRNGSVETMAFAVRIPRDRLRELTYSLRKVREKPRDLAATRSKIGAENVGLAHVSELLQRGDEGSVRRADHGIAGAVENKHAVGRRVLCQFSNEPALSRAGFTDDQGEPAAFTLGSSQEGSERGEFARAADEGKRRCHAEWSREGQRVARGHSQI
jgi:hypothetical protein